MLDKRTLTRLNTLRVALAEAARDDDGGFSRVFHDFLDAAEDPAMMRAGKATKAPLVKAALEQLAGSIDAGPLQNVRMLRIADAGLVHGGFFVGATMGSFFFFEKEEQGLVAIHQGGGLMLYSRLTMTRLPPGTMPVKGPKGPQ
jgi:hypothetical protein